MKKIIFILLAVFATMNVSAQVAEESFDSKAHIGTHEGILYVDLGLPSGTMWADYNVGTKSETGQGCYIMSDKDCKTDKDPVSAKLGGKWKTPTVAQWEELTKCCDYFWMSMKGVNGVMYLSKLTKQTLFIPAYGYKTSETSPVTDSTNGTYYLCSNKNNPEKQTCSYACSKSMSFLATNKDVMYQARAVFVK